jgi:lipopolysaccharide transport system ATP-binding protein
MSFAAVEVFDLSKRYDLGEGGLLSGFKRAGSADIFWALRDVSFTIREGESVGLIGSNGAGKSTLLKILSRVTAPTAGRARIRGRMGTILEVGTGFHPELTGRENIFLSGSILGMRTADINRRFDEIVDFAGVEAFVDTPVKRYSSGMYVRLAFAVAAHLDPDILIVDEVLAVGDVAFQKKCLAKMDSTIHQAGRTIVFVSHNMQAIRSLCSRALLLDRGSLIADGTVGDVLARYISMQQNSLELQSRSLRNRLNRTRGHARISTLSMANPAVPGTSGWTFKSGDTVELKATYTVLERLNSLEFVASFAIAGTDELVASIRQPVLTQSVPAGQTGEIRLTIPKLPFLPGEFSLTCGLCSNDFAIFEDIIDANVNLPHLIVAASDESSFGRGLVSVDFSLSHAESEPSPAAATLPQENLV